MQPPSRIAILENSNGAVLAANVFSRKRRPYHDIKEFSEPARMRKYSDIFTRLGLKTVHKGCNAIVELIRRLSTEHLVSLFTDGAVLAISNFTKKLAR